MVRMMLYVVCLHMRLICLRFRLVKIWLPSPTVSVVQVFLWLAAAGATTLDSSQYLCQELDSELFR